MNRRWFLTGLAACRARLPFDPAAVSCDPGVPGGRLIERIPFEDEPLDRPLEQTTGVGLDARRIVDLTTLEPDRLVLPAERFYVRTAEPLDPPDGSVRLVGAVERERVVAFADLLAAVEPVGVAQWECSGNGDGASFGLMSAGTFDGVPLAWLLDRVVPTADAALVQVTGRDTHPPPPTDFSTPGASWVFPPDALAGAYLLTHQDGLPLLPDHGAPLRLWVPGWYGCANVKWVDELAWVTADAEATSQMQEFAARTHQDGVPERARDYAPAEAECSAVAVRVERWEVGGEEVLRVVGLVWGGRAAPAALHLWMDDVDLGPVAMCAPREVVTWGLWHAFLPRGAAGAVTLWLTAVGVPARRLDARYYDRTVVLG